MYKIGQKVWGEVLSDLKISVSASNFKTWFLGSYVVDFKKGENSDVLTIGVKSSFLKEQIERRYQDTINQILARRKVSINVNFVVGQPDRVEGQTNTPLFTGVAQQFFQPFRRPDSLNAGYTFKNYVVGVSNNLAYIAATQVVGDPGKIYNPFLVYGPTGVGKTHLLQAIGNDFLAKYTDAKVLYVTAEKFTNDYLESLSNKTQIAFRSKYRNVHLLIIDDMQFLAGKESTQDEFFHTFNDLALSGRQIIAACDRHPKDLGKLKERLVSRFLGGMCVDIGPADLDMKIAIVKSKCDERGVSVDNDVIEHIASQCSGGARELEGMLTTTLAHIKLSGGNANTSDIKDAILRNKKFMPKKLTIGMVSDAVCRHFKVSLEDLRGSSRKARTVYVRQLLMYMLRKELDLPLVAIGDVLGGRDHSTVIHSVCKMETEISLKQGLRDEVHRIKSLLGA